MKLYNQVRYIEDILDLSENEMNTIINSVYYTCDQLLGLKKFLVDEVFKVV